MALLAVARVKTPLVAHTFQHDPLRRVAQQRARDGVRARVVRPVLDHAVARAELLQVRVCGGWVDGEEPVAAVAEVDGEGGAVAAGGGRRGKGELVAVRRRLRARTSRPKPT